MRTMANYSMKGYIVRNLANQGPIISHALIDVILEDLSKNMKCSDCKAARKNCIWKDTKDEDENITYACKLEILDSAKQFYGSSSDVNIIGALIVFASSTTGSCRYCRIRGRSKDNPADKNTYAGCGDCGIEIFNYYVKMLDDNIKKLKGEK